MSPLTDVDIYLFIYLPQNTNNDKIKQNSKYKSK